MACHAPVPLSSNCLEPVPVNYPILTVLIDGNVIPSASEYIFPLGATVVTLRNDGEGNLIIGTITIQSNPEIFIEQPSDTVLGPGEETTFIVTVVTIT